MMIRKCMHLRFRGIWGETQGEGGSVQGPVYRHTQTNTWLRPIHTEWETDRANMWCDPLYWYSAVGR